MRMPTFHILLVDDHPMIINGLQKILSEYFGIVDISLAKTGEYAMEILQNDVVHLLITDWDMPGIGGLEIAEYAVSKKIKTIVLTSHTDIVYLLEMESVGVNGILLKNMDDDELIETIMMVNNGKNYRHPDVVEIINNINNMPDLSFRLAKREKELLKYLHEGIPQKNITDKMFVSIKTVEKYVANIKKKMQVPTIMQAVIKALELGLIRK